MDLKHKLISLIRKQETQSLHTEGNSSNEYLNIEPIIAKFKHEQYISNPQEDQDIIEKIDKEYYEDLDTSLFELGKLPETVKLEQIDDDRSRLHRQLQAVSKKVSELVLQNHPAYAEELHRVMELQKTLQLASIICKDGRNQLSEVSRTFTMASLQLLASVRKRQKLKSLLKSLRTIKTLQRTDMRLREMMEEEDFCGAIQLCLECQKAAVTFRHYKCISELSSKLQDTLELIEERLDVALSRICTGFDRAHYEKVLNAYTLLDKRKTAMDQLHLHFTSAIHNAAFKVVQENIQKFLGVHDNKFDKMQFSDLCKCVPIEKFSPCLIDLCNALWSVMCSYYDTIVWHEEHDHLDSNETDKVNSDADSVHGVYIKQKLDHGLIRIYQDVQQKVRTYILSISLSPFKLEQFIQFLDIVNRMIEIGEDFCGSKSESLQDSLKQQSLNYFENHHRAKLDELRMFLENEGWELCPVKSSFHILNLVEFKFLRESVSTDTLVNKEVIDNKSSDQQKSPVKCWRFFKEHSGSTSLFLVQTDSDDNEDVFAGIGENLGDIEENSDSDSEVPDELKQDFVDELTGETHQRPGKKKYSRCRSFQKNCSIVTSTSLKIFRTIGKYLHMMQLLKPIAFEVMTCMAQLFDYYMYSVYLFYGTELSVMDSRNINFRLSSTLERIHKNLIAEPNSPESADDHMLNKRDKIQAPKLSATVNVRDPQKMFGLQERIVAAESLVFLGEQMEFLQPHLEAIIPQNKKSFLTQFFSQTVNMASELRKPVYWSVSCRVINYDAVIHQISTVKWDVKEIMSQHNHYIDFLIKAFASFNNYLTDLGRNIPVPRPTYNHLWDQILRISARTFVEGYASAKKCSIEGRALMLLDYQQFLKNIEKLIDIKPIPDREFVEVYIKAYYIPEDGLEKWLSDHREYSIRQLIALVSTVDHLNRKAKQKLINGLEGKF